MFYDKNNFAELIYSCQMQNYGKRPRQNVNSEPQTGQTGFRPGPSGAAGYSGILFNPSRFNMVQ
jgi:hypothetical protein